MKTKIERMDWMELSPAEKRLAGNAAALQAFKIHPLVMGEGMVMAEMVGRPDRWWFQGVRAMPSQRKRKDGVVTGQVFMEGRQNPCRIVEYLMIDGDGLETPGSCILRTIPAGPTSQRFVAPWKLASYEDAMHWRGVGKLHYGSTVPAMAKSLAWTGPDACRAVELLRGLVDAYANDRYGHAANMIARAKDALGTLVEFPVE